jgi:hypothetical protein
MRGDGRGSGLAGREKDVGTGHRPPKSPILWRKVKPIFREMR